MQDKSTLLKSSAIKFILLSVFIMLFNMASNKVYAQQFCADEVVYWFENFGTGTNASSHPDVLDSGLTYQETGWLQNEGVYRVINNTHQKPEWHDAPDHTPGDVNGKMLVVNGQSERFFVHTTTKATGFEAGYYSASLFLLNVNTPGTCAPNPLLPLIHFRVLYQDENNNWIQLLNSPISSGSVPQTADPVWMQLGGVFTLPATNPFTVTKIRISLADGEVGGCGNDFAIDDIKLASCPSGGPLPVSFIKLAAAQKGSGAIITWSTASELNNKYFDVERSTDGGLNWQIVANLPGSLSSAVTKNYAAYDAKPVAGNNLYRIKQVDIDGRFKNSSTVNLKISSEITAASVLSNPFYSNITADFLSNRNQVVNCRLIDVAGKQIFSQQVSISKGNNRHEFNGLNTLSKGLYILQITGDDGVVLYNDKLIKQ